MTRRGYTVIAWMVGGCVLAGGIGYTGVDFYRSNLALPDRVEAVAGRCRPEITRALGPPTSVFQRENFKCARGWACTPEKAAGGDVLFYHKGFSGCYLYLDERGCLVAHECHGS